MTVIIEQNGEICNELGDKSQRNPFFLRARAMNAETDRIFEDLILKRGVVTAEQLAAAHRRRAEFAEQGKPPTPLLELLIEQQPDKRKKLRELAEQAAIRSGETRMTIGGFELMEKIGAGGMGTVYRANQKLMGRHVALKLMKPKLARNKRALDRFVSETRASARINHPNVVEAIDAGKDKGYYYFAMELVDGPTLWRVIQQEGKLPEERCEEIGIHIARALQAAHQAGLAHRDVKPENILIEHDTGTAKLADLGLAKVTKRTDSSATQAGVIIGTPNYISPEQARGDEEVDIRSDIYSLGATLYFAATGTLPFGGRTAPAVMSQHISQPLEPPNKRNPELSFRFSRVIQKMMAKKPENRYQTPAELLADLERVRRHHRPAAGGSRSKSRRTARTNPLRNPWLLIAAAAGSALLTAIIIIALTALFGSADPTRVSPAQAEVHYQRAVNALANARTLSDLNAAQAEADACLEAAPEGENADAARAINEFIDEFRRLAAESTENPRAWVRSITELRQLAQDPPHDLPFAQIVERTAARASRERLRTVTTTATDDVLEIAPAIRWAEAILATAADEETRQAARRTKSGLEELAYRIPDLVVESHMDQAGIPPLIERGHFVEAKRRMATCVPEEIRKGPVTEALQEQVRHLNQAAGEQFKEQRERIWALIDYDIPSSRVRGMFDVVEEHLAIPALEDEMAELRETVDKAEELGPKMDKLRRLGADDEREGHDLAKLALDINRDYGELEYVADRVARYQAAIDTMLEELGLDDHLEEAVRFARTGSYQDALRADRIIADILRHPHLTPGQQEQALDIRRRQIGTVPTLARVLYERLEPNLPMTAELRLGTDTGSRNYTILPETDNETLRLHHGDRTVELRWDRLAPPVFKALARGGAALISDDDPEGLYALGAYLVDVDDHTAADQLVSRALELAEARTDEELPGRSALVISARRTLTDIRDRHFLAAMAELRAAIDRIRSEAELSEAINAWKQLHEEHGDTAAYKERGDAREELALHLTDAVWNVRTRPLNEMMQRYRWRDILNRMLDIQATVAEIGPLVPPRQREMDNLIRFAQSWLVEAAIHERVFAGRPWRGDRAQELTNHDNENVAERAGVYAQIFEHRDIPRRPSSSEQRTYAFYEQRGEDRVRIDNLFQRLARLNAVFIHWPDDEEGTAQAELAAARELSRRAGRGGVCLAVIMMDRLIEDRRNLSRSTLFEAHRVQLEALARVTHEVPRIREVVIIPRATTLMQRAGDEGDAAPRFMLMAAEHYEAAAEYHENIAREYRELGHEERAAAADNRAEDRFEKALSGFEAMIAFPERWDGWVYHGYLGRGRIRRREGQFEQALRDYQTALRRSSGWWPGYRSASHIADLCLHSGDLDQPEAARRAVETVLQRTDNPNHRERIRQLLEER